jgi:hypothetical protein
MRVYINVKNAKFQLQTLSSVFSWLVEIRISPTMAIYPGIPYKLPYF